MRNLFTVKSVILVALLTFVVVFSVTLSGGHKTVKQPAAPPTSSAAPPTSSTPTTQAPSAPAMTTSQQQAVQAAQGYLSDGEGFSAEGLLQQLTSNSGNGFATSDAQFALNYLNPNWDAQAVETAQGYLSDSEGFSEEGLLQQLTSNSGSGFTNTQAGYAVNHLNPDWDAQAVEAARGYVNDGEGFSESGLVQQLTSTYGDGFTDAQAEYAVNKVMG